MLIDAYLRAATGAMLNGQPFESLPDACRRRAAEDAAAKIVSFDDWRKKLRPERGCRPRHHSKLRTRSC
jgi:hypothetical protein